MFRRFLSSHLSEIHINIFQITSLKELWLQAITLSADKWDAIVCASLPYSLHFYCGIFDQVISRE